MWYSCTIFIEVEKTSVNYVSSYGESYGHCFINPEKWLCINLKLFVSKLNYLLNLKMEVKTKLCFTEKLKRILGSSDTSSATGLISSPFFPLGYAQNKEVYEYILSSASADDYIQLTFDDWHLSKASLLYVSSYNG